jgi:hypothetical protein
VSLTSSGGWPLSMLFTTDDAIADMNTSPASCTCAMAATDAKRHMHCSTVRDCQAVATLWKTKQLKRRCEAKRESSRHVLQAVSRASGLSF